MKGTLQKMWRSGTALLLAFCMVFGLCTPAFADETDAGTETTETKSYVSLGDSMTNGYGLPGYDDKGQNGFDEIAQDAYPSLVAAEYGWDLTQLATSAERVEDLHYILDYGTEGAYPGDEWTQDELVDNSHRWGAYGSVEEVAQKHQDAIANADVISVGTGNANFGVFLMGRVMNALGVFGGSSEKDAWINFEDALSECDAETKAVILEVYDAILVEAKKQLPEDLAEPLTKATAYTLVSYVLNYNGVLDRIVELNPDAEIIIVGLMNTLAGTPLEVEYEGQTYTLDMGDVMAVLIEPLNLYLAALPAAKQAMGEYGEATIYYAEASRVDTFVKDYTEENIKTEVYSTVRDRFVDGITDDVFALMGDAGKAMGLKEIELEAVQAYEAAAADGTLSLAQYIAEDSQGGASTAPSAAAYLAFESAAIESTASPLTLTAFANLSDLEAVMAGVQDTYSVNVQTWISENQDVYSTIASTYGIDAATTLCTCIATPTALKDALLSDSTTAGLLNMYTRLQLGNGLSAHPSASGHAALAEAIIASYDSKHTAADSVTDKVTSSLEYVYELLEQYGPEILENAYGYAEEMGYIDQLEDAIAQLEAEIAAKQAEFIETAKPEIEAAIAELEAELAALKAELEAELTALQENLNAQLEALNAEIEAKKAELENASEELKAELEAAIAELENAKAEIEAKIAQAQAMIEELQEKIAEIENAINELKETLAEIEAEINALYEAGEELKAALEELIAITKGELEGDINAAMQKIEAAVAEVSKAIEAAETVIDAVNAAIDGIGTAAEAIETALAELGAVIEEKVKDAIDSAVDSALDALEAEAIKAAEALTAVVKEQLVKLDGIVQTQMDVIAEAFNAAYIGATTGEYTLTKDSYYVSIGDSSVTGSAKEVGAGNAFAYKLAAELGLDTETQFAQLGLDGMRAEDLRYILDETYTPDAYGQANFGSIAAAKRAEFTAEIEKADLITVGLGNNNFTTFAAQQVGAAYMGKTPYAMNWSTYVGEKGVAYIENALADLKADFLESGMDEEYAEYMTLAVESYAYGYVGFACNYTEAINKIHEINPDAQVIVVGMYNPLDGVAVTMNNTEIAVGDYLEALVELSNLHYTAYAMLTPGTVYVNAPDVDTVNTATTLDVMKFVMNLLVNGDKDLQANADGHVYIKNQILKALNITVKEEEPAKGLLGDADSNGVVDMYDATMILEYYAGIITAEELDVDVCDVDGNGVVDMYDATMVLEYYAGIITEFPAAS